MCCARGAHVVDHTTYTSRSRPRLRRCTVMAAWVNGAPHYSDRSGSLRAMWCRISYICLCTVPGCGSRTLSIALALQARREGREEMRAEAPKMRFFVPRWTLSMGPNSCPELPRTVVELKKPSESGCI